MRQEENTRALKHFFLTLFSVTFAIIGWGLSSTAQAVPSFSRQTGMTCMACHTAFPELTSYGRWFKLNGYVSGEEDRIAEKNDDGDVFLEITKLPPISAMLMVSDSFVKISTDPKPNAADDNRGFLVFPAQFSLFYAGEISPNLGAFVQCTYDSASGGFGWDNTDMRYATHFQLGSVDTIFGLTLNNNPTVQDVFNTVPAWGFPYTTSPNLPSPMASPLITNLGGSVGGLGTYLYLDKKIYMEGCAYRMAPQGFSSTPFYATLEGFAPYWRLAIMQEWGDCSAEIGTFGMVADVSPESGIPEGISPDRYADYAADAQFQYTTKEIQGSLQCSWIKEFQTLNATFAQTASENIDNQVELFRINGTIYCQRKMGFTLAYFGLGGTADTGLYAPGAYMGSANSSPDSNGLIFEMNYLPWLNTKLTIQYTEYWKFNGGDDTLTGDIGYDGVSARKASDNNTLMAMAWFAF